MSVLILFKMYSIKFILGRGSICPGPAGEGHDTWFLAARDATCCGLSFATCLPTQLHIFCAHPWLCSNLHVCSANFTFSEVTAWEMGISERICCSKLQIRSLSIAFDDISLVCVNGTGRYRRCRLYKYVAKSGDWAADDAHYFCSKWAFR